jgi:hypothetical protein
MSNAVSDTVIVEVAVILALRAHFNAPLIVVVHKNLFSYVRYLFPIALIAVIAYALTRTRMSGMPHFEGKSIKREIFTRGV